jgi:hypothetical protein
LESSLVFVDHEFANDFINNTKLGDNVDLSSLKVFIFCEICKVRGQPEHFYFVSESFEKISITNNAMFTNKKRCRNSTLVTVNTFCKKARK